VLAVDRRSGVAWRLVAIGAACAAALVAAAPALAAQNGAARPAEPAAVDLRRLDAFYADPSVPNVAGFWRPAPGVARQVYSFLDGTPLPLRDETGQDGWPYRPEWRAVYEARRTAELAGVPFGDPTASCWPPGLYKSYIAAGTPIEITQTPGRVQMIHERFSQVRRIFTDGTGHPEGEALEYTLNGHSVGHWDGQTLVVDSVGLRRETTLSTAPGLPHSEQLHVVERLTRVDPVTLLIEVILDDPKAMTRPVRTTLLYKLWLGDRMPEEICEENNRNQPNADLVVETQIGTRKRYGYDLPQ
jgi:hypothetical protein